MEVIKSIFKGLGRLFMQPIFLILLLIAVSGSGIYLFTQNRSISGELNQLRDDPTAEATAERDALVEKAGKLTQLPEGETPSIATVTDAESIKNQPFFTNAQNGDKVLIYTEAKRAILYRPDANKVIEIAPINLGDQAGLENVEEGAEGEEGTVTTLGFSNGTDTPGLTTVASDELADRLPGTDFEVTSRTDAVGSYEGTIVVALGDGMEATAQSIADALGGTVGDLPEGETAPETDILVILGSDYISE